MTRVQIHDLETAPPQSADALKSLDHKYGMTLNIFGAMANSPAVLNTFAAIEGSIAEHTSLDRKTREAIHLTVANVNECTYCQGAYTMAAKAAGFDEDQTKQIRRGALEGDDKLTALLALTREVAANRGCGRRDVADRAGRRLERAAASRGLRGHRAHDLHQLLQPLRGHRAGRARGTAAVVSKPHPRMQSRADVEVPAHRCGFMHRTADKPLR